MSEQPKRPTALTQAAITAELARHATDAWLASLPPARGARTHEAAMTALHEARDEFGR